MTNSIQVCGRSKAVTFNLSKFDYSQDSAKALAAFSTLVATRKAEVYKAFNELCHICYAKANTAKTAKERHAAIQESRDDFFSQLPKRYASAYAKGITALEWGIDEFFEDFDFSDFLESEKKESAPKQRGAEAVIESLKKKLDSLQNKKNRTQQEEEERLIYAFLVKASKEFSLK